VSSARPPARPGAIRRFLARLVDLLPTPPDENTAPDLLLEERTPLTPEERSARERAWRARFRWGRGDGHS
jgi:hypothetical protein